MKKVILSIICILLSCIQLHASNDELFKNYGSLKSDGIEYGYMSYTDTFSITGKTHPNADKISVTWDGDNDPYFLEKYTKGDKQYSYNVSDKFGNLKEGLNVYTVIFWNNGIGTSSKHYHKVIYKNKNSVGTYTIKKIDAKTAKEIKDNYHQHGADSDGFKSFYYENEQSKGTYHLSLDDNFGDYILDFGNGYKFEYTVYYEKPKENLDRSVKMKFKFLHTDSNGNIKYSNEIQNINFTIGTFNSPSIVVYPDNRMVISTGAGHEGVARLYYFSPAINNIYDVHDDILKKELGHKAYWIYSMDIQDNHIIIEESRYCCDNVYNPGGHETHTIDLNTLKLVSSTLQEPVDYSEILKSDYEEIHFTSDISLSSSKSGYNIINYKHSEGTKMYPVINSSKITEYNRYRNADSGFSFDKITGNLYQDKYVYVTSLKGKMLSNKYLLERQSKTTKEKLEATSKGEKIITTINTYIQQQDPKKLSTIYENFIEIEYKINQKHGDKYIDLLDYMEAKIGLNLL